LYSHKKSCGLDRDHFIHSTNHVDWRGILSFIHKSCELHTDRLIHSTSHGSFHSPVKSCIWIGHGSFLIIHCASHVDIFTSFLITLYSLLMA